MSTEETGMANGKGTEDDQAVENDHDPHFEPIVSLPIVTLPTMEEEEVEMIKLRAKLFRYDTGGDPPEWKERGTGEVKLLRHKDKNSVRVVMRRDKTLKICANHFVTPCMELKPNCGSDRAWVWSVVDFADETPKAELLAIKFANVENAKKWKECFEEAKFIIATKCSIYTDPPPANSDSESEVSNSDGESYEEINSDDKVQIDVPNNDKHATETAEILEKLNINKKEDGFRTEVSVSDGDSYKEINSDSKVEKDVPKNDKDTAEIL